MSTSVGQWTEHFKRFAHRAFPQEDMYVVNQTGRGLSRNAYSPTIYKIRKTEQQGPTPPVAIVSDVAANVNRARALVKRESIKKGTGRKNSRGVSKRRGGKTSSKKRRNTPKKKRGPKKKTNGRKKK